MTALIQGSKGGSKKQRAPRESPDSLVSIAYARLLDLVSEGEIYGLVDRERSIYLDETPADGAFAGFSWEQRTGTQDQSYMAGFPQVENETTVQTELRHDLPWQRTFTNNDLSAIRINFSVPRLAQQHPSNGDITGYRVDYAIDVAVGSGGFEQVRSGAFDGKTSGGYERSVRIDLPESNDGWTIRVRRLTPNSTSSAISDITNIKSFTEIIDAKFSYPNSAVIGISFDAESFGGAVPKRGYHLRGRIIRVPSNYDPESRTYSGIWDGTFKPAYTNNPAWVYYDLLLHPRYGLGDRITAAQVDKWGLYQIAQYCDQLVSDGKGGQEPRFTCNLYLQRPGDAYKVLQDIAAIFRGITYWGAGQAIVSADMPADFAYTYTNGNVVGGKFAYKGSKRSTRYSAALVSWNDPTDMFRAKVEYVQDEDAVARFGVQTVELSALGCTSQGQAQRAGKWALLTNLLETETVTFSVGLDGVRARPGQIIRVADNDRAGRRIGGRVASATETEITVDKVEGVQVGDELTCILPNGTAQTRSIYAANGNVLTVLPAFDAAPVSQSVWAWESETLAAQRYRIVSISESGPLQYDIVASKYVEGKHAAVDSGAIISQRPITSIPSSVQIAPENVRAVSNWMISQTLAVTTMTILWDAAKGATRYDVEWRRDDDDWVFAGRVGPTEIDVVGIYAGTYQIRVRALNSLDIPSPWAYSGSIELAGKTGEPPAPAYLNATSIVFGIALEWGFPAGASDTLRTEIRYSTNQNPDDAIHLGDYAYPADSHTLTGLRAAQGFYFQARLIDRTGNIGPWSDWVFGQSSADSEAVTDYLVGKIGETELSQKLRDEIARIGGISDGLDQAGVDIGELNSQVEQLELQLSDITGAQEWDASESYLEGALVKHEGALYRARKQVPTGTPVSDLEYWDKVGDYASIGEAVAALAVQVSNMQVAVDEATGAVTAQGETISALVAGTRGERADGDKADALEGWNTQAQIAERDKVEASDKEALAERLLVIDAELGDNKSQISSLQQAFVDESISTAQRLDKIIAVRPVRADGDKADALRGYESQAQIVENARVQASDSEASAERYLLMQAELGDTNAALQVEQQVRASADSALSSQIQTQQAELGDTNAALRQVSDAVVDIDDKVSTSWSVRMQVNQNGQYVYAGVGLGIENVGGVLQSQFLIEANRFALLNTLNGVTTSPFIVDGGQVFMNSAVIKQADIVNLIITGELRSGDYVEGEKGIRLNFLTGQFEMNGTTAGEGSMTINNQRLEVKDSTGEVRVRLGRL